MSSLTKCCTAVVFVVMGIVCGASACLRDIAVTWILNTRGVPVFGTGNTISGDAELRPCEGIYFPHDSVHYVTKEMECNHVPESFSLDCDLALHQQDCPVMLGACPRMAVVSNRPFYVARKPKEQMNLANPLALDDTLLFIPVDTIPGSPRRLPGIELDYAFERTGLGAPDFFLVIRNYRGDFCMVTITDISMSAVTRPAASSGINPRTRESGAMYAVCGRKLDRVRVAGYAFFPRVTHTSETNGYVVGIAGREGRTVRQARCCLSSF